MASYKYDQASFYKLAPNLKPGDEVIVSGNLTQKISGLHVADPTAPPITFVAEQGAKMGGWDLISNCSGLTFKGFHLLMKKQDGSPMTLSVSGERIVLEDITVIGEGPNAAGGTAFILRSGDITLRRWSVLDVNVVGSIQGSTKVLIEDMVCDGIFNDGIQVSPAPGALIRFERISFSRFTGEYAHRDAIQLMKGQYTFEAVGITVNTMNGTPVQGIFTDSGSGIKMLISGCAFLGGQWNAIYTSTAGPAPGSVISDNFFQGRAEPFAPVGQVMAPRITAPNWALGEGNVFASPADRAAFGAWLARNDDPRDRELKLLRSRLDELEAVVAERNASVAELMAKLEASTAKIEAAKLALE